MKCSSPSHVKDEKGFVHAVPCNRCIECRINRTTDWATRLWCELPYYDESSFITLTFDDAYMSDPSLHKRDLQLFFKRVRKMFPIDLKQFSCGEYGPTTMRKHYHAIVLGVDFKPWKLHGYRDGHPIYNSDTLSKLWPFGFATVDEVTDRDIKYVTGYIRKKLSGPLADVYKRDGLEPPFQLQSKGIGLRFAYDYTNVLYRDLFLRVNGKIRRIPKYMAKKIGLAEPIPDVGLSRLQLNAIEISNDEEEKFLRSKYSDQYCHHMVYKSYVNRQKHVDLERSMELFGKRDSI